MKAGSRTVCIASIALFAVLVCGFVVGILVSRTPGVHDLHGPVAAAVALPFMATFALGALALAAVVVRSLPVLPRPIALLGFGPAVVLALLLLWMLVQVAVA